MKTTLFFGAGYSQGPKNDVQFILMNKKEIGPAIFESNRTITFGAPK
jgi:hypothetical protein